MLIILSCLLITGGELVALGEAAEDQVRHQKILGDPWWNVWKKHRKTIGKPQEKWREPLSVGNPRSHLNGVVIPLLIHIFESPIFGKPYIKFPVFYLMQSISIANGVVGKDPCLNPLAWINPYVCCGGISYMLVPESGLSYWLHHDSHSVVDDVNHVTANKPHIFCFESHSFARSRTGCWDHFLWKITIQFDESHLKSCVFSSSQGYI